MPITILSAGPKRPKFLKAELNKLPMKKFTDSAKPKCAILRANESGRPLLFLKSLHQQSPPLASASSSSVVLCGLRHLSLAEEF